MRCKTWCGWWKLAFSDPESTSLNTLENTGKIYEWDFRWGYFWQFAVGRFEKVLKTLFEYCSKWISKTSLLEGRIFFLRTSLSTSSWGTFKITRGNEVTQNLQTFYSLSISVKFCRKNDEYKNLETFLLVFVVFRWEKIRTKFAWNISFLFLNFFVDYFVFRLFQTIERKSKKNQKSHFSSAKACSKLSMIIVIENIPILIN